MIDWNAEKVEICCNEKFPIERKALFFQNLNSISQLKNHFVIATSGSMAQKWAALSKEAMLASAKAVNNRIEGEKKDIWIKNLPNHHVGGLSIYARAFLSGAKVVEIRGKWDPCIFKACVEQEKGTLTSLVPAQVFDLVKTNLQSPKSLRAAFIGGGVLTDSLYEKAKALGWPLLPTYGLTECSSQVATASYDSPDLFLLPHIEAKIAGGCLAIKSPALLSGFVAIKEESIEWHDPKKDGWLQTEDLAELSNSKVVILGRKDCMIKIAGELVNVRNLESILEEICLNLNLDLEAALIPIPDERLENKLCLVLSESCYHFGETIRNEFFKKVLPFEQIRSVKCLPIIPKTELGKIAYSKLKKELESSC